jgi:hypothetical protein
VKTLIEKRVLTPKENRNHLLIDLYGVLARLLKIASGDKVMINILLETRKPERKTVKNNFLFGLSIQVVAGTGFEPMTFGL